MKKRTKKTPQLWQDRNRERTDRQDRRVSTETLFIEGLARDERERLRTRIPYSGAADFYIASFARYLALATRELLRLRPGHAAIVSHPARGFVLTSIPVNDRELIFRYGFQQGTKIAGAVLVNAVNGVSFGRDIEDSAWAACSGNVLSRR